MKKLDRELDEEISQADRSIGKKGGGPLQEETSIDHPTEYRSIDPV
jgi:hypothetical protein